jgi:hypothetical protein
LTRESTKVIITCARLTAALLYVVHPKSVAHGRRRVGLSGWVEAQPTGQPVFPEFEKPVA